MYEEGDLRLENRFLAIKRFLKFDATERAVGPGRKLEFSLKDAHFIQSCIKVRC